MHPTRERFGADGKTRATRIPACSPTRLQPAIPLSLLGGPVGAATPPDAPKRSRLAHPPTPLYSLPPPRPEGVAPLFGRPCVARRLQTTEEAEVDSGCRRVGEQAGMLPPRALARPKSGATRGAWVFQQTLRLSAPTAPDHTSVGQRPRNPQTENASAESAIHSTPRPSAYIFPQCRNRSARLSSTSSLAPKIANRGWISMCVRGCSPTEDVRPEGPLDISRLAPATGIASGQIEPRQGRR